MADVSASLPPPVPRLRLSRQQQSMHTDFGTPGPSRLPDTTARLDSESDVASNAAERATPNKISFSSFNISLPPGSPLMGDDDDDSPAARLRAVLNRVPNESTSTSRTPRAPVSVSELDSDFEPPGSTTTGHSIAQGSLRDIFNRALREPGDTPQKSGKWRRNSIDMSEVEDSPRIEKVNKERLNNKEQRQSLSDEEVEANSTS
jgi:serine/arginine repetitive matrix protein 2